jgi:alkaline phosphatase
MLEIGTQASLKLLSQDPDGFFLMIEGSQIDWGGHENNTRYIVEEILDFDRAVGLVLDFAINNPGTLVIVTADHETGGFSIVDVDRSSCKVGGAFTTGDHTGVMVPVYAFGPQSNLFSGTYDNTDIFFKMKNALGF